MIFVELTAIILHQADSIRDDVVGVPAPAFLIRR